jgi:hypothetical protein
MLEPEVAASVVAALATLLTAGGTEAAKKLGSAAAERLTGLYDRLKARLTSPLGQAALAAIKKAPARAEAQGTLRIALEEELATDPAFHAELAALLEELRSSPAGAFLASTIAGDANVNVQIAGSDNQVGVGKQS